MLTSRRMLSLLLAAAAVIALLSGCYAAPVNEATEQGGETSGAIVTDSKIPVTTYPVPEENIRTAFDHHQLNRVWENIISNSVKYTPKGTTLFVRLMKSADGKNIIIHIGDNGPGIPEQMKSVLLDPFVVAEPSRSNGQGTGLGLSVAQRIVEAHGGAISILNEKETALAVSEFTGSRGTHGLFYRIVLPVKKGSRE